MHNPDTFGNSNKSPMGTEEVVMHYSFFIQKGPLAPFPIQNIKNLSLSPHCSALDSIFKALQHK